jgi:hypothetical protein
METADFEHTLLPPPRNSNFSDDGITPAYTEIPRQPTVRGEFELGHFLNSKVGNGTSDLITRLGLCALT